MKLVIGGPQLLYVGLFAALSILLEVFVRYARYVSVLKWLTLTLFAYVGVVFVVHVPWMTVQHLVIPKLSLKADYLTVVVAILGTTISPYLFFWQAEEEVEEVKERDGAKPLARAPYAGAVSESLTWCEGRGRVARGRPAAPRRTATKRVTLIPGQHHKRPKYKIVQKIWCGRSTRAQAC